MCKELRNICIFMLYNIFLAGILDNETMRPHGKNHEASRKN